MLAGIYLIEDASTWPFGQSELDISGVAEIRPPDITILSRLLQLKPEVHFNVGSNFCKLQWPRSKEGEYGRYSIKEFTPIT
jgi:hypothetical protein